MMDLFLDIQRIEGEEIYLILERTAKANHDKAYVPAYYFGIHRSKDEEKIGYRDLRIGHNKNTKFGGNVGYVIDAEYRGNYYAAKAWLLLFQLVKDHGLRNIVIRCDPDNIGSRKTCPFLRAKLLEVFKVPDGHNMYVDGRRCACRYEIEF